MSGTNEKDSLKTRVLSMKAYRDKLVRLMEQRLRAIEAEDYDHNTPVFAWGAPGIGKSMIAFSVCKDTWVNASGKDGKPLFDKKWLNEKRPWDAANWHLYDEKDRAEIAKAPNAWVMMDVRLSQIDPVEIKGAPYYDAKNGKANFLRFASILPDPNTVNPVFLFLDELPLAADMIQSAAYQLINDRKVGDYHLPAKCVTIAAGNQSSYGGTHYEMSPALESRFSHLTLDVDYDGFVKYMSSQSYDETMVAFLQYYKEAEKAVLYKLEAGAGNFPTFRSWEKAARMVRYGEKEYDALADNVGQAVAAKYEIFKEMTKDIPEPEVLVKKKLYYEETQMQLVACQKVGNVLLNRERLEKIDEDKAFEYFRYFLDMRHPKDKTDKREEIAVLFLVNVRGEMSALKKINAGYIKALKAGTVEPEKKDDGKTINNIYDLIFKNYSILKDVE